MVLTSRKTKTVKVTITEEGTIAKVSFTRRDALNITKGTSGRPLNFFQKNFRIYIRHFEMSNQQ